MEREDEASAAACMVLTTLVLLLDGNQIPCHDRCSANGTMPAARAFDLSIHHFAGRRVQGGRSAHHTHHQSRPSIESNYPV
jgi:hypothetical protein